MFGIFIRGVTITVTSSVQVQPSAVVVVNVYVIVAAGDAIVVDAAASLNAVGGVQAAGLPFVVPFRVVLSPLVIVTSGPASQPLIPLLGISIVFVNMQSLFAVIYRHYVFKASF